MFWSPDVCVWLYSADSYPDIKRFIPVSSGISACCCCSCSFCSCCCFQCNHNRSRSAKPQCCNNHPRINAFQSVDINHATLFQGNLFSLPQITWVINTFFDLCDAPERFEVLPRKRLAKSRPRAPHSEMVGIDESDDGLHCTARVRWGEGGGGGGDVEEREEMENFMDEEIDDDVEEKMDV